MADTEYKKILNELKLQVGDPVGGYFGPGSMAWRVNREVILGFAAMRALLMQVAHPKVAQGVADHSQYRQKPFKRAYTTLKAQQEIVFGDCDTAARILEGISRRHNQVKGHINENGSGVDTYFGNDPGLKLWVHATLIDSVLYIINYLPKPFSREELDQFYRESVLFARLMGIPGDIIPPTMTDFEEWMAETLDSKEIWVTPAAKSIAASLLRLPFRIFLPLNYVMATGTLPEKLRIAYGFSGSGAYPRLMDLGMKVVRAFIAVLPVRMRWLPPYWRALKRCKEYCS